MKLSLAILALCVFLLPSCKHKAFLVSTPTYLQADSPSDPPGLRAARAAERAKRVKDGAYKPGEELEVQGGRVFVFRRNPDIDKETSGAMVSAQKAKIVVCEGMYYYAELSDGSKGYVRETDLVNPQRLMQRGLLPDPNMEGLPPTDAGGVLFPEESVVQGQPIELDANQKLMTNSAGRTVMVVNKTSEKTDEFEARKKAMMGGGEPKPLDDVPKPEAEAPSPTSTLPAADDIPDLPEPTAAPAE